MMVDSNDNHKKYARFAAHSLEMATVATDPDSRALQREMAIEWLKLAEAALEPGEDWLVYDLGEPESLPVARAVLVVDDDPQVLDVTAWMLEDLGCEVITAPSAKDALQKLATLPHIEILITDVNMPDMNGYQLADAATQMRDRLKVIMLSGREIDGRGYPFIRKPFLREDLNATMALTTGLC
jgi:CheY-like chemotaxis protein